MQLRFPNDWLGHIRNVRRHSDRAEESTSGDIPNVTVAIFAATVETRTSTHTLEKQKEISTCPLHDPKIGNSSFILFPYCPLSRIKMFQCVFLKSVMVVTICHGVIHTERGGKTKEKEEKR